MDGFQATGELIAIVYLLADNFRDTHFRRRSSLWLSRTGTGTPTQTGKHREAPEANNQRHPRHGILVLTLASVCYFRLHLFLPGYFPRFVWLQMIGDLRG
jgi:hypothetical protein